MAVVAIKLVIVTATVYLRMSAYRRLKFKIESASTKELLNVHGSYLVTRQRTRGHFVYEMSYEELGKA
jgi:hypothetical protein